MRHLISIRACLAGLAIAVLAAGGCYKPKSESAALGTADNPISMYFVPSNEAEGVLASAEELASLLSAKTGLTIKAGIATSYVSIVESMGVGQVQVGWLPPVAYVYAHERNGDEALLKVVRKGKATYRGQVVVLAASPYKTIADLKGKRVAFPEQTSASGYYYPSALFKDAGLDVETDIEPSFTGGHETALLALLNGAADAACSYEDARDKVVDKGFKDVLQTTRILAYTPEIPADNVTVAKSLDPALRTKLSAGLLELADDPAGKAALKELYDIDGLVAATDGDYAPVRAMMSALGQDPQREIEKLDEKRKK
jgi:phosphonate transport system substrate-binding protein